MGTSQAPHVQRGAASGRLNLRRVESILRRYPEMAEADPMSDRDIITGTPNRAEGMPGGGGVGNPTLSLVMRMESERERMSQVCLVGSVLHTLDGEEEYLLRRLCWDGRTQEEIANELGCNRKTVAKRRRNLLEKFGQAIFGGDEA